MTDLTEEFQRSSRVWFQGTEAYADELREYRRHFDGDILFLPGDRNGIYTREGTAAVQVTLRISAPALVGRRSRC